MPTPLELVEAFISAGELEDAVEVLDECLAATPYDTDAIRLRAELLLHLPGRARDALYDLDHLPERSADDHLLRARAFDALGDEDGVFAAIEQAYSANPDLRNVDLLLNQLYKREAAERALNLLADLPKTWHWLSLTGDFHALTGDYVTAAAAYCSALDDLAQAEPSAINDLRRAVLLLKRADIYRQLGHFKDADADYAAASAIIPNDPTIAGLREALKPHPPTPAP